MPVGALNCFDAAIDRGDLQAAWTWAAEVPLLSLDRALRLTMLMAQQEMPAYERAARRWLVRLIREFEPSLGLLREIVSALEEIGRPVAPLATMEELSYLADAISRAELGAWRRG